MFVKRWLAIAVSLTSQLVAGPCSVQEILDAPVVVNLDRFRWRYEITQEKMRGAGFTNIVRREGVDGFATDEEFFDRFNIRKGSLGQKGCAASHLLLWKELMEGDREFLFVCEDDMLPHSQFSELFPLYWEETPDDFDLVLVGSFMHLKHFQRDPGAETKRVVRVPGYCTHAYILSKKGAKRLYELYTGWNPERIPKSIDCFLFKCMWNRKIVFYNYNGRLAPDLLNLGLIDRGRSSGICFQNEALGSVIWSTAREEE